MTDHDLGQMPTPSVEEPELMPGGVDALKEDPADEGLARDLTPDHNPAIDDALPEEISEPDDKPQAPEASTDGSDPTDETPV